MREVPVSESSVLRRISEWEAGGLIDAETAARLRAAEAERLAAAPPPQPTVFGPTPTVAEVLGYVGAAFVLAAWFVLVGSQVSYGAESWSIWTAAYAIAGAVTAGLGIVVRSRGERGSRATGVFFATSVGMAFGASFSVTEGMAEEGSPERFLIAGLITLVAAVVARTAHTALLTQLALLGSILVATAGIGMFIRERVLSGIGPEGVGALVLDLTLWLVAAIVIGIIGLREATGRGDAAAGRAALSRFGAGLTAVVATASILTRSGPRGGSDPYGNQEWGRILEPAVAEAGIAIVALILLGLALRRGAPAYLYPAALGIVIALTDLNAQYVADQVGTGVALLLEGIVILGAGLAADRVRRRLAGPPMGSAASPAGSSAGSPPAVG